MKTILKFGTLCLLAMMTFSSCEEEIGGGTTGPGSGPGTDPGTQTGSPASVVILSGTGGVTDAATVSPLDTFIVSVDVTAGDDFIKAISIKEDGVLIENNRIDYDGTDAPANPWLIPDDVNTGFASDISIVAQGDESTRTYTVEIIDDADRVSSQSVVITTMATVVPPTILIEGSGMLNVSANALVSIPVSVTDVTNPLYSIGVLEDGQYISDERLWYGAFPDAPFPSNPALLPDGDANGLMTTVYIRAHAEPGQTKNYAIVIGDESGGEYTSEFTITTGSAVLLFERKLFFNADGPNLGGLDLDNGDNVSSISAEAEIRDQGINTDLGPEENWIQRISGVNGTEVRHLFPLQNGLPENFDFANISSSEELASFWDNGLAFTEDMTGQITSQIVEIGDTFIAKKNDQYYMFKVTDIVVTTTNNEDYYQVDIKL